MTVTDDLMIGSVVMRLPMRVVPRKCLQVFLFLFFLAFIGMSLLVFKIPTSSWSGGFYVLIAFMMPFGVIGIVGCTIALLKSMPSSPYYNIQLDADTFTLRQGFKVRRWRWPELAPFALSGIEQEGGGMAYYVAILAADDAGRRADHFELYNRALANLGDYCGSDAAAMGDMISWLNAVRSAALKKGCALQEIEVPYDFRDYTFEVEERAAAADRAQGGA
jgi:hypothetical protein